MTIQEAVRRYLRSYGYKAQVSDDATDFRFACRTEDGHDWRSQIVIYPEASFVQLYAYVSDELYDDHHHNEVVRLAALVTDKVLSGAFFEQVDTGAIIYRQFLDLREQVITSGHIERWMALSAFSLTLWHRAYDKLRGWQGDAQSCLSAALIELGCVDESAAAQGQLMSDEKTVAQIVEDLLAEISAGTRKKAP